MKRNLLLAFICLLLLGQANSQVLLTEGFEGATFPPANWTRINAGAGNDWQVSDYGSFVDGPYTANTGTKCMVYEYTSASAANAWMVTPSIAVTNGNIYAITFSYRIRSATYPEKMKVTVGNAATVAAQTTTLWDNNGGSSLTNTSYVTATINYTATSTGNVFFGFNCYSAADQWAMQVDDIQIEKLSNCAATPVAGTASGPAQACPGARVNLSVTGNTASLVGISYKWQTTSVGGSSWTDVPGAITPAASVVVPAGGADYRFVVTCSNAGVPANSNTVSITSQTTGCPPANDDYCGATTLVLNGTPDCGNTTTATSIGDPAFTSSTPNNTVWYKYTPSVTGQVNIVMSRPTGVTTGLLNAWVGIYTATGTCPTLAFTQLPATTGYDLTTSATVTVASPILTAGTTYYFMVDGNSGATGQYCIKLEAAPAPPACVSNISPANNATSVSYLPNLALSWNTSAGAASYDLYIGTTNPPSTAAPINVTTTSTTLTGGAPNTTYYWYVVPKTTTGISAIGCTSNITSFTTGAAPAPPANNDCAGAIAVSAYFPVSGTTFSATESQAAEVCASFTGNANDDVWFKFTTSQAGAANITLTPVGTTFDAVMIAYSGTCGSLTSIGCADATAGGGTETLSLTGLAANTTYYFRVYGYGAAGSEGEFTLTASGAALPVSIVNFKGEKSNGNNLLSWTTATEINNAGFELQRSVDGINFSSMAYVASKAVNGSSNAAISYTYTDTKSLNAGLYYRLNQIDKDGKSSLSNVVFIKGTKATKLELASIYPNPAIDKVTVLVASPKADNITFVVSDLAGKVILIQQSTVVNGDNNIQLNVASLAKGTYAIKVVCADGCETAVSRFIKQ